jgi:type VI protein secretion system component Hcp
MEPVKRKVGLISLGLHLILIGSFYLMNQYTDLSLFKDLYLLWPLFLIMLGLEFIITKFVYDMKGQEVQLSPSILSILTIVIILGLTAVWRHIPNLKNITFHMNSGDFYRHTITESLELEPIPLENGESITVNNTMGRIDIKPSADDRLSIKAKIQARTNDEERAREYIQNAISVQEGTHTLIETKRMYDESRIIGSITVDYTILVPKKVHLKVENNFGDIVITDIQGDVSTVNKNGDTRLSAIAGNVTVQSSFGRVMAEDISGDVKAENKNGEISTAFIGGHAVLETSFGDIKAKNVTGDLTADTKNGDIEAYIIGGNAYLVNSFGHISCNNIQGNVMAENKNGNINVENAAESIKAETSFGSISWTTPDLENVELDAQTRFGNIDGDSFDLPVEKGTTTSRLKETFGTGSRKVWLKTSNGSITIKK